ncbi:MAG: KpsF/GutQ family sugar-phosphate isomerase [Bacteroidota bacterium]|uniref:Arabinose 5-phosphate isomerase n=1 Tax=Christiangramia flava JLT2011 TaxID=1229726 RepID=A0A1L7I7E8_9FLAO|nr:KpsF/GutQ family sugar-phosphate isomerase [Christiangramia flava]APU69144.1 Arabinose 5-phosphate isomerase [Christiangramia flava JLT2011]MAM18520.1 KpsF/GutQ family sugar-phosphate isomerase [Christiangramia sp.]MEE2772920.1 KpsF/GutQ family sugar-phosphate isomerase [Bacteroidota bacterium]OSS38255.1 Arabinose 5-phosphate isomerase [Christiangramia flava JLT2011]
MKLSDQIISSAKETISNEAQAISNLKNFIDSDFVSTVETIYNSQGRVVVTGIGKSAIIANKIVATLNSTGTPAIFMHAADAIHGDLGIVQENDVVICISKSGNSPEIKVLVPLIKNFNNKLIALTANKDSFLGKEADHILNCYIEKEACPNNLAPTTSTTAQMVVGDALAICLLDLKGFTSKDFAKYHPGGTLGKKLYLRVSDIAGQNMMPQVSPETDIASAIVEISEKMLGVTAVIENEQIIGIITDGDIRRMLKNHQNIGELKARDIMSASPKTIDEDELAVEALDLLEKNKISQLLAVKEGKYKGVVHIHNLIREGIL